MFNQGPRTMVNTLEGLESCPTTPWNAVLNWYQCLFLKKEINFGVFSFILIGTNQGRRGRGAIYIWASGNGGIKGDNCAYDSYASSVYTLSVSALTPQGKTSLIWKCRAQIDCKTFCFDTLSQGLSPYYAEPCPAVLTSLYVGGQHLRPKSPFDAEKTDNVVRYLLQLNLFQNKIILKE